MLADDYFYFNGINGNNGKYDLPPTTMDNLIQLAMGLSMPENLNELRYRSRQASASHLGVRESVDPKSLEETGWGVIFTADADPRIKEALTPLLDLRREQAGEYYRIYEGSNGFKKSESKGRFLARHGAGPGPADPEKVPYYLLIVGSPEEIPYEFQTQLDIQYAVGRIHFDTIDEYEIYARSVQAAETGRVKRPRQAAFFATSNEDDPATAISCNGLAKPLYDTFQKEESVDWAVNAFMADDATKSQLSKLLGGSQTPAFLFAASHGLSFMDGNKQNLGRQGALLCQDWPGPQRWSGSIPQEFYYAGDDLGDDANLVGLVAFFFGSYCGGTLLNDQLAGIKFQGGKADPDSPFVAQLPVKMLGHPQGGALAVIAQVGQAWGFSYESPSMAVQLSVYESVIRRLFDGHPVGSGMEYFNERYAELTTVLSNELEEIDFGKRPDPLELSALWIASNDAKSYSIIGDPAVRLPVFEPGARVDAEIAVVSPDFNVTEARKGERKIPEFVIKIRSSDPVIRQEGIDEALEIARKAIIISDQAADRAAIEEKDELEYSADEKKILDQEKSLNQEIRRLVRILEDPQAPGRYELLSILTKLAPVAKKEALPVFRKIVADVSDNSDTAFQVAVVPAIVATEKDRPQLIGEFKKLLRDGKPEVRAKVMESVVNLDPPTRELDNDLWALSSDPALGRTALQTLFAIENDKTKLLSLVLEKLQAEELGKGNKETLAVLGGLYLTETNALNEAWAESKDNRLLLMKLLNATIVEGDRDGRLEAIEWLRNRIDKVPGESIEETVNGLKPLYLSEDTEFRGEIVALSEELAERKKAERNRLRADLRSSDSSVQIDAIKWAVEIDDEWALRILIQEWVQWIASGRSNRIQLVEEAAEKMRNNAQAVLPLINHLTQDFQPRAETLTATYSGIDVPANEEKKQKESIGVDEKEEKLKKQIDDLLNEELLTSDWNIHQRILKQLNDRKYSDLNEEAKREIITALIATEFRERELRVHQRIARQLADMSNYDYYEKRKEDVKYKQVRKNLEIYGVPVLARLLPAATDDEIRKNLAYTLGNVGGRESVDALARAVVGEERTRANRQKLLAEYYLDPSKKRSDEASKILTDAVAEAQRTLRLQQYLNVTVFIVGLFILVGGIIIMVFSEELGARVAGALSALGGLGAVLYEMIKKPMDRIQSAMANLVQIETAFTSFIWELNLNGTYIQSQYVAEGILTDDDIAETIGRIEEAMNLTMDQVSVYTDKGRQDFIPHIERISPAAVEKGGTISIFGKNLERENGSRKNKSDVSVAINHLPISGNKLSRSRNVVKFSIADEILANLRAESGVIWVSLIVEGRETNALPLQLVGSASDQAP